MTTKWFPILLAISSPFCTPSTSEERTVTVFAAASTSEALEVLAHSYQEKSGVSIRLSFASSSVLARQIEAGAHADLFISANPFWMDRLVSKGLARVETRRDLLHNRLVLIVSSDVPIDPDIAGKQPLPDWLHGRLAMGDPDHVPAGIYAKRALEHLGWWDDLDDRLAPAQDVRAALRLVETGETDAGIVYHGDVINTDRVRVAFLFPESTHGTITYPIAFIAEPTPGSRSFYDFLFGEEARAIFRKHGFSLPNIEKP